MSSLLSRGQAMHNRVAEEQSPCGDVTYARVSRQSGTVRAWVGRTLFAGQTQSAARVEWGDRDYLVTVAAFEEAFGVGTKPAKGDRIVEAGTGTFELQTPTGEPVWRYSDQTRTVFRLHCKRVA